MPKLATAAANCISGDAEWNEWPAVLQRIFEQLARLAVRLLIAELQREQFARLRSIR